MPARPLSASPNAVSFTRVVEAPETAEATVSLVASDAGLAWSVIASVSWLSVAPMNGVGSGLLTLTASAGGMGVGTHEAVVTVESTDRLTPATKATRDVTVTLQVVEDPAPLTIEVVPGLVELKAPAGGRAPAPTLLAIRNTTPKATLRWALGECRTASIRRSLTTTS